jgi:glycerol-3-phosphate acyltransferase PlsY
MQLFFAVFFLIVAFAIGSTPTALLMSRSKGIDIRRHGSGNVGATNVLRVMGKKWGILCLALDVLKGWLPVTLMAKAYLLTSLSGLPQDGWMWLAGLAAIAGHMFSPFLGFKGGKGVATSLGALLAIAPLAVLVAVAGGGIIIWLTGYVSLASIACSATLPVLIVILNLARRAPIPWTTVVVTLLLAAVIAWKHRANIRRLRQGTESRVFDRFAKQSGPKEPS